MTLMGRSARTLALAALAVTPVTAQPQPAGQTITIIVSFAAGGFADSVAR